MEPEPGEAVPGRLANIVAQQEVRATIATRARGLEMWLKVGALAGKRGCLRGSRARIGPRMRMLRRLRYGCRHPFAATRSDDGIAVGQVRPRARAEATNSHPDDIASALAPGKHGAMALDGAGSHRSNALRVPDCLTPLRAPRRPEQVLDRPWLARVHRRKSIGDGQWVKRSVTMKRARLLSGNGNGASRKSTFPFSSLDGVSLTERTPWRQSAKAARDMMRPNAAGVRSRLRPCLRRRDPERPRRPAWRAAEDSACAVLRGGPVGTSSSVRRPAANSARSRRASRHPHRPAELPIRGARHRLRRYGFGRRTPRRSAESRGPHRRDESR